MTGYARIKRLVFVFILAGTLTAQAREPDSKKLQVFILAGQSNMVGHARAHTIATLYASDNPRDQELLGLVFRKGSGLSLETLEEQLDRGRKLDELTGGISNEKIKALSEGPEKKALEAKVKILKDAHEAYKGRVSSSCVVSNRVYISSIADGNTKSGKLGFGYGGSQDKIGPEFGFGLSLARHIDAPILIIKTSWGGKSLHYNFRPPSAGPYEFNEKQLASDKAEQIKIKKDTGLNYRMMSEKVAEVLASLKDYHPDYDESAGYDLAGFVWFQGFNDQFSDPFRDNYKENMITFIKDVRKQYEVPKMPFVIGVLGTGMTAEKVGENKVSLGQRAAAEHAEFKGNVAAVESYKAYDLSAYAVFQKGWPQHYHEWDTVGSDRPYHYLGSGKFFVRFGDALASSMAGLIEQQ